MPFWPQGVLLLAWLAFGGEAAWAAANYEPYAFTHFAGSLGGPGYSDGTGSAARFSGPAGVAVDPAGNVYVADSGNHTIRKITPSGVVSTLAGLTGVSGSDDGTGSAARFNSPFGVAVDSSGNVYVADTGNDTIRKITPGGVVTTLAGLAGSPGSADGTGSAARFGGFFDLGPKGVAVDASGNVYVADTDNYTIRKITPGGAVTTLAGLPGVSGTDDGTGDTARFNRPFGVAVDSAGNVYVADTNNDTIRKITPDRAVTTLAGLAGHGGSWDGTDAIACFYWPNGVAVDSAGNVYVADTFNFTVRKITPSGVVTTLAGKAGAVGSADGTGSAARFNSPSGVAVDSAGNVYTADSGNNSTRKVTPGGSVTTLAGMPGFSGSADGLGSASLFRYPDGVAADSSGNVYVADTSNHSIRKITPDCVVTTLAGLGGSYGSDDGAGSAARFYWPGGVAVDSSGNVYVADSGNRSIRKITPNGAVNTLAGLAGSIGSADGTGSAARFNYPVGVAVDSSGNVYVADRADSTIRRITPGGLVTTLAGLAGAFGTADGTGSAARFKGPSGVAVDFSGDVYVADTGNSAIRKITPGGVVTTLAGLAGTVGSADGTGSAAAFNKPFGVAVDSAGNVYVADSGNHTIRKITPEGVVTTLAGRAGNYACDDGAGGDARFNYPSGVAVDSAGNVYVADSGNNAIRKGVPPPRVFIAPDGSGLGYVNVTVPKGWSLIANPLYENTVSAVLKPPEGSILFALGTNGWFVNAYAFGAWADPNQKLAPGEGVFLQSPAAVTLTLSGQIPQGTFTNHVPAGLSLKAAIVPQGGRLDTDLGFPVAEGDIVYRYVENGGYLIHSYLFGGWDVVPVLQPGEAFFVRKLKPADWVHEFHLNP